MAYEDLDQLCINTIRMLSADGVEKANSGHPGMPMGDAAMAYVLWTRFVKHNPGNPRWANRDRFVLSAGHGSMLLYSLLHLTGYPVSMENLKAFRQWGSLTAGHPEYHPACGIETTTGPLGQGFGNGVGMAMAEAYLASVFNRPGFDIVDHYTYGITSDGDLMEGVSSEAASLAGHLGLGKLIYLYSDNKISIEGSTELAFTEDVGKRFEAYHWHVQHVDGNDIEAVEGALRSAQAERSKPSLIIARTHIGFGSPNKQDTADAHGAPLGADELRLTKEHLGWPPDSAFHVPEEARGQFRLALSRGREQEQQWQKALDGYARVHPDLAAEWRRFLDGTLPDGWDSAMPTFKPEEGPLATRSASGKVLNAVAGKLPLLIGGSADLAPSNNTYLKAYGAFSREKADRNIHFGVREHAMGAILNGLALSGLTPYGGTFLIFSDYMRPAMRLAALMEQRVIYVLTHDSIGLGEDGPTHQPIEQLASLRAIPHMTVIRPADANETSWAWRMALEQQDGPVCLMLTRQKLPIIDRSRYAAAQGTARGGYILADAESGHPDVVILASGSEVSIALEAHEQLKKEGVGARVVSMPDTKRFDRQDEDYRNTVLPPAVQARISVEAGVGQGWEKYVGAGGQIIGIERFGASAPGHVNMEKFGFTAANLVDRARALLKR